MDAEASQEVVANEFIEGDCGGLCSAAGIGHSDQIEVCLQEAVFAGGSVYCDVGKVELSAYSVFFEAEIVLINVCPSFAGKLDEPLSSTDDYEIREVSFFVDKGTDSFGAFERYLHFRRVAAGHDSD